MVEIEDELKNLQVKRKLASLQKVAEVTACENDNNLEVVKVLGWQVVVQKDSFKVDDRVVYFEIDSKLGEDRWNEEMAFYDFRVTTVKIAGILSQGFIKKASDILKNHETYNIGDDLTEVLDVVKYDEEEIGGNKIDGGLFPGHIVPYTDEPRIQSEPKYLDLFKGKAYVATEKYDGSSATFLLNPNDTSEIWLCSRDKLRDPKKKDHWSFIADKYKLKDKLKSYPDLALQGEIYGPTIQKNLLGVKDKSFAIFNVYSLSDKRCLDYDEMVAACEKLGLPCVRMIERGDSFNFSIEDLFEKVKGTYEGTTNQREGLVFRLAKSWYTPNFRASFKIISNEYLSG